MGQGADAPDDPNAQNAGCLLVAVGLSFLHKVAESQMSQQLTHSPGIGFTSQLPVRNSHAGRSPLRTTAALSAMLTQLTVVDVKHLSAALAFAVEYSRILSSDVLVSLRHEVPFGFEFHKVSNHVGRNQGLLLGNSEPYSIP